MSVHSVNKYQSESRESFKRKIQSEKKKKKKEEFKALEGIHHRKK